MAAKSQSRRGMEQGERGANTESARETERKEREREREGVGMRWKERSEREMEKRGEHGTQKVDGWAVGGGQESRSDVSPWLVTRAGLISATMPNPACACAEQKVETRREKEEAAEGRGVEGGGIGRWRMQTAHTTPCAPAPRPRFSLLFLALCLPDLQPAPGTPGPRSPNYRSRRCNSGALSVNSGRIDGAWRPLSQTPQFPPPSLLPSRLCTAGSRLYLVYIPIVETLSSCSCSGINVTWKRSRRICDRRESVASVLLERSYPQLIPRNDSDLLVVAEACWSISLISKSRCFWKREEERECFFFFSLKFLKLILIIFRDVFFVDVESFFQSWYIM